MPTKRETIRRMVAEQIRLHRNKMRNPKPMRLNRECHVREALIRRNWLARRRAWMWARDIGLVVTTEDFWKVSGYKRYLRIPMDRGPRGYTMVRPYDDRY